MEVSEAITIARRQIYETGIIVLDELQHKMIRDPEFEGTRTYTLKMADDMAEAYNILANLHERFNLRDSKK